MNSKKEFIEYALAIGALELIPQGRQLKSGRISPYFFNSALFKESCDLVRLGKSYAETVEELVLLERLTLDTIYGPAYKGIPLAVLTTAYLAKNPKHKHTTFAFNRKEAKDHGEGGVIVGDSLSGKHVVIVDDVITTGESIEEALRIIRAHGGIPVGCVISFDRDERISDNPNSSALRECSKRYKIPFRAIASCSDLIRVLAQKPDAFPLGAETLPKIYEYRTQYGIYDSPFFEARRTAKERLGISKKED